MKVDPKPDPMHYIPEPGYQCVGCLESGLGAPCDVRYHEPKYLFFWGGRRSLSDAVGHEKTGFYCESCMDYIGIQHPYLGRSLADVLEEKERLMK